jgi:hypothetical protein
MHRGDKMLDALNCWVSFRRNANFWDWVRDTYSDQELEGLTKEATDCSLIRPYNPFGDETMNTFGVGEDLMRTTVKRLIKRYGDEIWSCCLGAGGYDPDEGTLGLKCLSKLNLAFQVYNQATFEEFLVRNALKRAAQQMIEEHRKQRV